jgi:DNA-binding NtrC family response regulator
MSSSSVASARVLLVEDDAAHALLMRETLETLGGRIEHARTQAAALAALERRAFDVVVLDAGLPDGSGFEIQAQIRSREGAPPIVFVTSDDLAEHAIDAVRAGAAHYVIKRPSYLDQMREAVCDVLSQLPPKAGQERARAEMRADTALIGESSAVATVRRLVVQYGASDAPVLITGETGTGKELVARGLHGASGRAKGPFVAVNCAAIATHLFESEVFGSVKGAYTGSIRTSEGLVGTARGGTLFLDEVGELPVEAQAKLLRLLEAGTYRPVGASEERIADARVVAATNQNVDRPTAETALRSDLYYRLAVLRIHISPLRERRGDIGALVTHFIAQRTKGGPPRRPTPEALASLMAYDWPGNVRELEHTVARTLLRGETGPITRFDTAVLPDAKRDEGEGRPFDTERLTRLLAFHGGQLGPVAQELGTSVRTLQRRLRDLRLRRADFRVLRG